MNDIAQALKTAGVKLPPLRQRVWNWVHDHPNHTSGEIAKAIHANHGQVATNLSDMRNRDMVISTQTYDKHSPNVLRWSTHIKTYELLPPAKNKTAKWEPVSAVIPAVALKSSLKINVETLTLKEARELYIALKEYFGA